ncbi:MAG: hypothetical protein U1E29_06650 [Coriobacteriia bacterium]|nr:hypothetical protein [Coriobacteriia bacterium]
MSSSMRRRLCRLAALAVICAVASSTIGAPAAVAVPGNGRGKAKAVEPGWPESHYPENDPRPGEPGFVADTAPATAPADGMTDDELMAADPAGFAQVVAERAVIERSLLTRVRATLKAAGITPASERALAGADLAQATAVLAAASYSPYGYLQFTLTPNSTSQYARSGYLGMLYFMYGIYNPTVDAYKWSTVSWPARSGDNRPYNQSRINVGPIPAYTWDFGFMNGAYRGYEGDGRVEFSPGKWRLDPWTGAPYGRSCLEVHGGTGSHTFGATSGCIRLYPGSITSLRSYHTYKMANKYDRNSAHLIVRY